MSIADNVARVHERVAAACARAGRPAESVRLMAVSKTFPASAVREAHAAGMRLFGENRVQEFAEKAAELRDLDAEFHLIGHLQSNKSGKAAELFHAVDSVDTVKLARRLDADAGRQGKRLAVLLEINIGGESAKSGFGAEDPALEELLQAAPELENIEVRGLMAIPPHTEDPEGARPYFGRLRKLHEKIGARKLPAVKMEELSMGMSHDFEVAIAEGSTCVRVGTAIFGARAPQRR